MHATYGWTAAGQLPFSQDIRPTAPRIGTMPQCVPPRNRLAQWCLLLCFAHALLTTALDANAMPPQELPQELPTTAVVGGPFPIRSLSPIQLLYFQFTPERAITLPRGMWNVRFERPQYFFDYVLNKDERTALKGTSGAIGIGDIALSAKAVLREEGPWAPTIAGRFALKLPTGDEDRALGSGEVDVGLGVDLEKTFGPVRLYFNTGLTIPTGNPFSGTGIDSLPMLSTFLTGEYHLTERFSLLVQLNGVTSPVRNTGLDINRPTFEILAGFNWALPGLPVIWQPDLWRTLMIRIAQLISLYS